MRERSFLRRATLAGVLALSFLGAAVAEGQAMPVAPVLAQGVAQGADGGPVTAVQYMYRRYPRRFYRHRRAGLYNCGPGALRTHLERKACGFAGPSRSFLYRR